MIIYKTPQSIMDFPNKQLAKLQSVVKSKKIKNKEKMSDYVPDWLPIGNPPYQISNASR